MTAAVYPQSGPDRSRWILERRGPRNPVISGKPYAYLTEKERGASGTIEQVSTIFLTNRECPWKCVMCDLWRNTAPAAAGSIPGQIRQALAELPRASVLKLYNSGSFFDLRAIPKSDWAEIALLCREFRRVIVECHPRLANRAVVEFKEMLPGELEVAMGLETAHVEALERLNKRSTLEDFSRAASFLRSQNIAVRAFLLVGVPFVEVHEQRRWLEESIRVAFANGAEVASLIPTRTGNGALETLATMGAFREPDLAELEGAQEYGIHLGQGRVFADTWDLQRFSRCGQCFQARHGRLERMNLGQKVEARISCRCGN